jgi:hypothetical protein
MTTTDLSPLLKVSARLLDLHDSRRKLGESTQYQSEERAGLGDGTYFALAGTVLTVLQENGTRSGDEFSSATAIIQAVQERLSWAKEADIEYALNVLSRPTELKLQHTGEDGETHVIGDKETNLVEKAAHISEFRLAKIGRTALAMSADNMDITYIEGDVTKLIRAIEAGRLTQALGFVDRLIDQLRSEHLTLISLIERTSGGRRARPETIDDLETHAGTMRRAVDLVNTAQSRVDELARSEAPIHEDVPLGLIREKVRELSRGIVRYAREVSLLATKTLSATSTDVNAPSFAELALHWVSKSPSKTQLDTVLSVMGPTFPLEMTPMGTDFAGLIKARGAKVQSAPQIDLNEFSLPIEHQYIEWLKINQAALEQRLEGGALTLQGAVEQGFAVLNGDEAFGCLVAALTTPEEWVNDGVEVQIGGTLQISNTPSLDVMYSSLQLKKVAEEGPIKEKT